jgi:hypothetical protein
MTGNHRSLDLSRLSRRPVLIAMMVYAVAYGAACFAFWREATSIPDHQICEMQSPAEVVSGAARHFLI